jgi:dolichol-phosphate mannosyltransferase
MTIINMKIDIIIPVYNEGDNIGNTLRSIDKNAKNIRGAKFTIKIVYDFKEDNTLPAVRKIQKKLSLPVKFVKNPVRGVVNAIKTGLLTSKADYAIVTMADMSDDYADLSGIVKLAAEGYDLVCPSRYMKGGKLHGGPFFKQLFSRMAGVSAHILFGIPTHDITNSYKLYKTRTVKKLKIESVGGFEIGMEIAAKIYKSGGKIAELPTQWWDRTAGESRFRLFKWIPKYLKWYFYLLSGKQRGESRIRAVW